MFSLSTGCCTALAYAAAGYGPGLILGLVIWLIARRSAPMPLFAADIYSFLIPVAVWFLMNKYHWSLVEVTPGHHWQELMVLGWVWSFWMIVRLLLPRFTHKLRFRLAAINVGSLTTAAAILLGLFFSGF